jgi:hypothetical protein
MPYDSTGFRWAPTSQLSHGDFEIARSKSGRRPRAAGVAELAAAVHRTHLWMTRCGVNRRVSSPCAKLAARQPQPLPHPPHPPIFT